MTSTTSNTPPEPYGSTLEWVDWFNHQRLFHNIGRIPPAEHEANHYHQKSHTGVPPGGRTLPQRARLMSENGHSVWGRSPVGREETETEVLG